MSVTSPVLQIIGGEPGSIVQRGWDAAAASCGPPCAAECASSPERCGAAIELVGGGPQIDQWRPAGGEGQREQQRGPRQRADGCSGLRGADFPRTASAGALLAGGNRARATPQGRTPQEARSPEERRASLLPICDKLRCTREWWSIHFTPPCHRGASQGVLAHPTRMRKSKTARHTSSLHE